MLLPLDIPVSGVPTVVLPPPPPKLLLIDTVTVPNCASPSPRHEIVKFLPSHGIILVVFNRFKLSYTFIFVILLCNIVIF